MAEHTYDEAAHLQLDTTFKPISVEDLVDLSINKHEKFLKEYKKRLYCPECSVAPLTLVDNNHLRAYPKSKHDDNCSHILNNTTNKEFKEYLDTISEASVNKRLMNLIDVLLNKTLTEIHPLVVRVRNRKIIDDDVRRTEVTRNAIDSSIW